MPARAARRLLLVGFAAGVVSVTTSLQPSPATAGAGGKVATVVVTLTPSKIRLVPAVVPAGAVLVRIVNKGSSPRSFAIAGKRTPAIAPGTSATLRLLLSKAAAYPYAVGGSPKLAGGTGALTVFEPCTSPMTSTVTVQMSEAPIVLSQSTIPCGTVSFAVTNAGTVVHSFDVFEQSAPHAQWLGAQVEPGQTATLTVRFTAKGSYLDFCGEPEHSEEYGETGVITVV